ncbi:ATP-binding protein [Streptomyces ochraceiscleroticus]|uniref:ATP-binding protein n=1 Tax=Streptomyces ochraceiscleroticus TaxID=47761 RepID=A0ABW1MSU7_9ACTN|nr:NB-ARC domain-containing protein [Streptomyces ochraceiscleroticus]
MTGRRRAGNLPAEARELVGRRAELAQVRRLCEETRLVTLTGVGGVGKTRLALRAAYEAQPSFRDGVWWVELSALRSSVLLTHTLAEALPLADRSTRPVIDVLADYLADRELLLILDTCEHLADACAMVTEILLRAAPGLRILATSRRLLGVVGEQVLTVEPLPVPEAATRATGEADAVVLLAARAAETVPGFTVTDANRAVVVGLCRRLEGLPLALELAAARLREWPLAELAERLADRFAALGEAGETDEVGEGAESARSPRPRSSGAAPPWHQALRTAIGWSHELCSPSARLLWARLSVFAGSFDTEAVSAVCGDAQLPAEQIPGLLQALVDTSILVWQPTGCGDRYRMLDTIREFGAGWLRRLGEEDALADRQRQYYLTLARRADNAWMGPEQLMWNDRMAAEHANLRAVLDHCLADGDAQSALEMGGALWFLWYACGLAKEGQHYLDQALALEAGSGPVRAKALWSRGVAAFAQGDTDTSLRLARVFREAVAGEADETAPVAAAFLEGASLTVSGRQTQAAEVLDTVPGSRPASGSYDAAWGLARGARAFAHVHLGQFAEAAAVAEQVRAECAQNGETWVRAYGDYLSALALLGLGQAEEAAIHARTALNGKQRLHDSLGIAITLDLLASASVASGRAEHAARLLGVSQQVWRTVGTPQMGSPELIAARNACEEQARRLIGDDAYRTAFRTGYDAVPGTGMAYALHPPETAPPHAAVD